MGFLILKYKMHIHYFDIPWSPLKKGNYGSAHFGLMVKQPLIINYKL